MAQWPVTRMTLLARIQQDNDDFSWEEYAHYYQNFIMLLIKKMGVQHHDAEDLCQRVLMKIWKILPEKELDFSKGTFRSWLSSITRYTTIDFLRSAKRKDINIDDLFTEHSTAAEIDQKTEYEWCQHLYALALQSMKKRFQESVLSAYIDSLNGISHDEIARELGIGVDTVKVYKARVKKAMTQEIHRLNNYL